MKTVDIFTEFDWTVRILREGKGSPGKCVVLLYIVMLI